MRSIEDKEISSSSTITFEFHKGNGAAPKATTPHRTALGKPTPSKWDDAQKWLVGLSRGERNNSKTKPRNSNADDTRLINPVPQHENDYLNVEEEEKREENESFGSFGGVQYDVETKKVDCEDSYLKINESKKGSGSVVRSVCVRDMGTEMTPIASQEPSRNGTPIRARTPVGRSPISSGTSTPVRCQYEGQSVERDRRNGGIITSNGDGEEVGVCGSGENQVTEQAKKVSPLETRALAWDEAERTKYTARYKREEMKIEAWENHEKRKAEMQMKKMEAKAERQIARAKEKYVNKIATTTRMAEERRANAEAKLNEKEVKTSEQADYIRRTGHLPSSFSFKFPSFCR